MQEYNLENLVAKMVELRKQLAFLPTDSFAFFVEEDRVREEISSSTEEIELLYEKGW